MSNFMDGIKSTLNNECNVSVTENGAVGFRTTGKALLDLNFAVASLRSASEHDISQRFTKAFFGSVRIRTRSSRSRASRAVRTGIRPTSSGMMPNLRMSCGCTSRRIFA